MTDHTPTPWKIEERAITTKGGLEIHSWFMADGKTLPLSQENAVFIVQAVNSYSHNQETIRVLLEAAKLVLKESFHPHDYAAYWQYSDTTHFQLREAIKLAEGTK